MQTVAAIRYVTNGSYLATIREFETIPCSAEMEPLKARLVEMANKLEACMNKVKEAQNQELLDFVARRLYEMAADCVMAHLASLATVKGQRCAISSGGITSWRMKRADSLN